MAKVMMMVPRGYSEVVWVGLNCDYPHEQDGRKIQGCCLVVEFFIGAFRCLINWDRVFKGHQRVREGTEVRKKPWYDVIVNSTSISCFVSSKEMYDIISNAWWLCWWCLSWIFFDICRFKAVDRPTQFCYSFIVDWSSKDIESKWEHILKEEEGMGWDGRNKSKISRVRWRSRRGAEDGRIVVVVIVEGGRRREMKKGVELELAIMTEERTKATKTKPATNGITKL